MSCILPWAQSQVLGTTQSDSPTTLDAIHGYFNDQALSDAIIELQQSYYGKNPSQWSGNNLLQAIQALDKKNSRQSQSPAIGLNP